MPISIPRSQQAALAEGFFDGLGEAPNEQVLSLSVVESVLIDFAEEFIGALKNNLEIADAISSGELSDSIRFKIKVMGGVYQLDVTLADYYDFVNKGVKGLARSDKAPASPYQFRKPTVSKAFMEALSKWIVREGLKSRIKKEARVTERVYKRRAKVIRQDTGIRTLAYVIGAGIKQKGLRATNFFDDAMRDVYPRLAPKVAKALATDVQTVFRKLNVQLNGNVNS